MRRFPFLVCLLLAGAAHAQDPARDPYVDTGPIETRNFRSLSVPFLRIDPRPDVLAKGQRTFSLSFNTANDLRYDYSGNTLAIHEDYELETLQTRYRQGLGHGMDLTVELPIYARWGGFLDPILDAWHRIFLDGNDPLHPRTGVPYGQCVIQVPGSGPYGVASGIGDVSVALAKQLVPRLLAIAALKAPTGNAGQILGSGAFDGALSLECHEPIGRWFDLYLQGGAVVQGASTELKSTRTLVHQEAFVVTWQPNRRDQWIFQIQNEASATVTGVPLSDATHRIGTFGYHRRLSARQTLEMYFSEDGDFLVVPTQGSILGVGPDFTAGVGVITRF